MWTLRKADQNILELRERKLIRKIFRGNKIGYLWMRRINQELKEQYKEANIEEVIKALNIRYLGDSFKKTQEKIPNLELGIKISEDKG